MPSSGIAKAHAGAVPLATCWDGLYWDLLNSRKSADKCASATAQAGYDIVAASNSSAKFAMSYGQGTAVFYVNGHSLDYNDGPNAIVGQAMLFESPDQNGDLDAVSGSSLSTTVGAIGPGYPICDDAQTKQCHAQTVFMDYPFADTVASRGCCKSADVSPRGVSILSGHLHV